MWNILYDEQFLCCFLIVRLGDIVGKWEMEIFEFLR